MRITNDLKFYTGSREEHLPYRDTDFPYLSSRARLDDYSGKMVPWHWHKAVELFYMESGAIRYETPEGIRDFPEGSGGMVNSNVLHMTTPQSRSRGKYGSGKRNDDLYTGALRGKDFRGRAGAGCLDEREGMLPGLPDMPSYDARRIHEKLSPADGLPAVGGRGTAGDGDRVCLRTGKRQPFWKTVPGLCGLHAAGLSEKM